MTKRIKDVLDSVTEQQLQETISAALQRLTQDPCPQGYVGLDEEEDGSMVNITRLAMADDEESLIFNEDYLEDLGVMRMTRTDYERICHAGRMEVALIELNKQLQAAIEGWASARETIAELCEDMPD